ncbi:hypothetical protein KEJ24_06285 [Candidatus Bathyarchaeota archaeon]|nr:hypothetical protein [Candidatus Bathyarchaeota archaeon]
MAWESDFEKPAVGGFDYVWIDRVDFACFYGHGAKTFFLFGTNHDADGVFEWRVDWHYEARMGRSGPRVDSPSCMRVPRRIPN